LLPAFKPLVCISGALVSTRSLHRVGADCSRGHLRVFVRPATIRRGSSGVAYVRVYDYGSEVKISADSLYPEIEVVNIAPEFGYPPFTSSIVVNVSSSAKPGTYYLEGAVIDVAKGDVLASTLVPIFVVDNDELTSALSNIERYRKLYEEYGIQYTLLKILAEHRLALSFTDMKILYESIVFRRVSNGTVGDLLSRLLRKGLIVKTSEGYILNPELDLESTRTIIDVKRAKNGMRGARSVLIIWGKNDMDKRAAGKALPRNVERVISVAQKLAKEDYWKAIDFVAHTLLGIRKTGVWLLWIEDYFVYKERKTGFLHYFVSSKLSELLRSIGLKPGFMGYHVHHSAEDLIYEMFGSYVIARRLHYRLKKLGWFVYGEPLLLEILVDAGINYIALRKLFSDEPVIKLGNPELRKNAKKYLVYGGEHIDVENEETYFYGPSRLR